MTPLLPESAPFSSAQRAWLNGFFAGVFALDNKGHNTNDLGAIHSEQHGATAVLEAPAEDETFPWHDPNLGLEDRMKLAEGKPLKRQMMAAMAQLNCGQCGYLCQTYSEALASGAESNIGLCVPGGKETKKKLKELISITPALTTQDKPSSNGHSEISSLTVNNGHTNGEHAVTYTKNNPYLAELVEVVCLNQPGSQKETNLVKIKYDETHFKYEAGDSLGIWAENCTEMVDHVIKLLGANPDTAISHKQNVIPLKQGLAYELDIKKPTDNLLLSMIEFSQSLEEKAQLKVMLENDAYDEYEITDLLEEFPKSKPAVQNFIDALNTLQPRLYSISSSPVAHRGEVHLTIAAVRYQQRDRLRKGVASTFFADRIQPGSKVRIFLHHSPHFRLPVKPETPVIMVGPGTGIAPFRSFLFERAAIKSTGKNWLFFGDQREQYDFLFREELEELKASGQLTRLDTAFSRDSEQKAYVQHRMQENAAELWQWLSAGSHFYVCGDAKRMAKDVHETLLKIIELEGQHSKDSAQAYIQQMIQQGRYCRDVY